jgi:FtsZ-interacting cell division protein ZipA
MDQTTIIIVAVVIIALLIVGFLLMQRRRTEKLQSNFGPEYDRALRETGDKRKAEAELAERQKRVEKLPIRPLDPGQRDQFTAKWQEIQAEFVDNPENSIRDADILLQEVMSTRGYPVKNFEQVAADISVDHPTVVQHFRTAHDIATRHTKGQGDTEDLRKAMINYRALFDELVTDGREPETQSQTRRTSDDAGTRERV